MTMSPHQLRFLLLLPILHLSFIRSNGSVEYGTDSTNCNPHNCGGVTIAYPFWLQEDSTGSSQQYCGYPGFGVSCRRVMSTGTPVISLPGDTYHIRNISYLENHTITLVDDDVANQACPRPRNNFTLSPNLSLHFSSVDLNLTFHFNCTNSFSSTNYLELPCFRSGDNLTYVSTGDDHENEDSSNWFQQYCEEKVVTKVIRDEINLYGEDPNLIGAVIGEGFGKGFLLDWFPPDGQCIKCENSGGWCSYRYNSNPLGPNDFLCVCSDGDSHNNLYCKGSGSSSFTFRWKIVVGIIIFFSATSQWVLSILSGIFPLTFSPVKFSDLTLIPSILLYTLAAGGIALMVGLGIILIKYCNRKMSFSKCLAFFRLRPKYGNDAEAFITQYKFSTPRRYTYPEIKRMTNAFKDKLGQGGFGSVYKGTLADGSLLAIKVLKESKGNGEEFFNEVASIGRTSHVNIVPLKGFCYEGLKRALVYEFMPNGSLEKFIFQNIHNDSEQCLRVEKLYEIALGTARGLEYLHRGCSTCILHLDIKPHNILLEEEFCPKISDFGLAKLHSGKESIVSMVQGRGTIGYTAPEVFNRNFGGVSHKSDVYSYGMMVLEMVGGRKNLDVGVVLGSEIYFPQWIYKRLELEEDLQLQQRRLMTAVENEIARKMIIVGLWCIQADPSQKPSMNKVIEMLVGSTEALTVPPNPFFSSPPRVPASSSTTLESTPSDENVQVPE